MAMQGPQDAREALMRALQLLGLMFGANEKGSRKVAFSEFYNQALSESMDVQYEYVMWRRAKVRTVHRIIVHWVTSTPAAEIGEERHDLSRPLLTNESSHFCLVLTYNTSMFLDANSGDNFPNASA